MTEVRQEFIDLLNVPLTVLRDIGKDRKIPGASAMSKWALAAQLAPLRRDTLEELTRGFLYAGRTSVSYFRLDDPAISVEAQAAGTQDGEAEAPGDQDGEAAAPRDQDEAEAAAPEALEGRELDPEGVRQALAEMSGEDPFSETNRPAVDDEPKLVVARERPDGSLLLTFVVQQSVAQVIHNFAQTPVYADEFFNVVLFPDAGLVEVRTNQQAAHRFQRDWLDAFAEMFELDVYPVSITDDEFHALKAQLNAGMTRYRGKDTSGTAVDVIDVRIAPSFDDLSGEQAFEDRVAGLEQQSGDLEFKVDAGTAYRIRVSRILGSIYFVTAAPDDVITHVRDALRTVKVRHLQGP
jgi:hypothetical protein